VGPHDRAGGALEEDDAMNPTRTVRLWSFINVFYLWMARPAVVELNERRCEIRIPLNWRTRRRDIHAMYLGVLCMGADVAAGLIAFNLLEGGRKASLIFKDLKAEFLKRAEGDVHFVNEDGPVIVDLVRRALAGDERQEAAIHVTAFVPTKLGREPVARFELTLSVRKRS
jgi:acyl-coenzyme A thioesterase PaaI-like protein